MSFVVVNASSQVRAAQALSSSSSCSDDDESSAAFSSSLSVRSRSSTIATTRSQAIAFQAEERSHQQQHRFEFEQPAARESYRTLAPSQTLITASPRTDDQEGSHQRGEGDAPSAGVDPRGRDAPRLSRPPVAEVRIPLSAVVRQGLVELSRDDWKNLYLATSKDLEVAREHMYRTSQENRHLKRKLIEMQKSLFESRRNRSQLLPAVPDHMYPWSIPDSRRSVGRSSSAAATTITTTRVSAPTTYAATTGAPLVVVTSTASEEDSNDGGNANDSFAARNQQHGGLLLRRPCKVQRRGSSQTASTTGSSADCSEAS